MRVVTRNSAFVSIVASRIIIISQRRAYLICAVELHRDKLVLRIVVSVNIFKTFVDSLQRILGVIVTQPLPLIWTQIVIQVN